MAPEIADRKPYNEKVDIWCLGVLLYELIHKIPPFEVKEIYLMSVTLKRPQIKFKKFFEFFDIVNRCCSLNPLERPSAEELL